MLAFMPIIGSPSAIASIASWENNRIAMRGIRHSNTCTHVSSFRNSGMGSGILDEIAETKQVKTATSAILSNNRRRVISLFFLFVLVLFLAQKA